MSRAPVMRLFVAVYPDAAGAEALVKHAEEIEREHAGRFRATPRELVHLTLLFIGDTAERELDGAMESVDRSVSGVEGFALEAGRLIGLPSERSPRLVAAETDAPAGLFEVQRRLATRLARNPKDKLTDRYLPHLTVGRFAQGFEGTFGARAVPAVRFRVERVRLMRSVLRPEGAEHAEVAAFCLGG
jgi:2'-5' RNA ligase